MSARRAIWHDVECGAYAADLPLWEELAGGGRRPGPRARLRHRPRRPAPGPARARGDRRSTSTRSWSRRCAERADGLPLRGGRRRRPRASSWTADVALALAPMQLLQLLAERRRAGRLPALRRRHLRPGGRFAAAIVEEMPEPAEARRRRCPTCARSTAGSTRACRSRRPSTASEIVIRRLRQTVSPDGELSEEPNEIRIRTFSADAAGGRGARGRPGAAARAARSPPPTSTSARPSSSSEKEA